MIDHNMQVTTKDILNKTLLVLERDGWAQRENTTLDGRHCLVEAVRIGFLESCKEHNLNPLAYGFDWRPRYTAELSLRSHMTGPDGTLVHWNDNQDRTYHDVVNLINTALKYQ